MNEKEIIQGCKRGDRRSYKALVDNYSKYMYAICYRYMGSKENAKDALQDSLVQVFRSIERYEERGIFKSWLATITVKKCLDNLRKEKRHQYSDMDMIVEPGRDEQSSLKLEHDDVIKFIEMIPEKYRIAINMFLVEGYSHKEIAQQLNVTEGGSRSLVSRGRKMIMDAFNAEQRIENETLRRHRADKNNVFGNFKII